MIQIRCLHLQLYETHPVKTLSVDTVGIMTVIKDEWWSHINIMILIFILRRTF